jgi:V/A-type H+-transporting ATPase subunit B
MDLRALAEIIGKAGLSEMDLKYLGFGDVFENKFLKQGYEENRNLEETLSLAWSVLSILPGTELTKIKEIYVKKYYNIKI